MIAIAFRFTAGRYHATLWGRHVNEGVPEWPPSPWRILRALVFAWRRYLPDAPASTAAALLERLAPPPVFHLPPARVAHTRHYMPAPERRALVLDTFVALPPGAPVVAIWPDVDLRPAELSLLKDLLDRLPYLGRAESWVQAMLCDAPSPANCQPLGASQRQGVFARQDTEAVRVLAACEPLRLPDLLVETGDLRRQGFLEPRGARWVTYLRPADCFSRRADAPLEEERTGQRPTVVRYAIASRVLPLVTDALRVGELTRRAAMSQYGWRNGRQTTATLSGKDPETGTPETRHAHAFYLPSDEDQDGRLDHVTVFAPAGFTAAEVDALRRVDALNPGGGRDEWPLVLLGVGRPADFIAAWRAEAGNRSPHPLFGPSRVWSSTVPFVLPRHPKTRRLADGSLVYRSDGPADQFRREVELRRQTWLDLGLLDAGIERLEPKHQLEPEHWKAVRWLEFVRFRERGAPQPPLLHGFGVRATFDHEVIGPLAFGYACHFGLGLLQPDVEPDGA